MLSPTLVSALMVKQICAFFRLPLQTHLILVSLTLVVQIDPKCAYSTQQNKSPTVKPTFLSEEPLETSKRSKLTGAWPSGFYPIHIPYSP